MKKIVYLSPIAYDDLKQRPQYLSEGLSKFYSVVFVEPTKRLCSNIVRGNYNCGSRKINISDNLTIFRCSGILIPPFSFSAIDKLKIGVKLQKVQLWKYLTDADYIIVGFEGWAEVIKDCEDKVIIYDKIDDTAKLIGNIRSAEYIRKCCKLLEEKSSVFMVTAKKFYDELVLSYKNKKIIYLPNGVNSDEINKKINNVKSDDLNYRIYGYVGTVSEWFDFEAIRVVASTPNSKVIIVGPCLINVPTIENVEYVGRVPKDKAIEYINSFDVCLYTFKKNELLNTINPVKIYEYLSLNKPVIAIDSPEMDVFDEKVTRYNDYDKLKEICYTKLNNPFDDDNELKSFVQSNSWDSRVADIIGFLEELK